MKLIKTEFFTSCIYTQVLQLSSEAQRRQFLETLQQTLANVGGTLDYHEAKLAHIYKNAFTKKKRDQSLERFFKTVFSEVFSFIYTVHVLVYTYLSSFFNKSK